MDDSINKLALLHQELLVQGNLSQLSIEWLKDALGNLDNGKAETMDEALGVGARSGVLKVGKRLRILYRNEKLKKILKLYTDKGMGNWRACATLEKELIKFKSRIFPIMKNNSARIKRATELENLLWKLFQFDNTLKLSAATLYSIFNEAPLFPEKKNSDIINPDNN